MRAQPGPPGRPRRPQAPGGPRRLADRRPAPRRRPRDRPAPRRARSRRRRSAPLGKGLRPRLYDRLAAAGILRAEPRQGPRAVPDDELADRVGRARVRRTSGSGWASWSRDSPPTRGPRRWSPCCTRCAVDAQGRRPQGARPQAPRARPAREGDRRGELGIAGRPAVDRRDDGRRGRGGRRERGRRVGRRLTRRDDIGGRIALTTAVSTPDTGRRPRVRAPELARPRLAEHRRRRPDAWPTCAAGSCCSTSGPSAASTACTSSTSCGPWRRSTTVSWSSSGCTRRSSCTRPTPDALARGGGALRGRAPGPRRPRAGDLAGLHRPGLADPRARRPGGLRRRAVRRRGARARHRRARRRAARGAPGQGHAAAGRLALRRARPSRPATCGSRPRRSRCPGGASWSPTPATTAWSSSRADAETVVRRIGSGERGLVDGARAARSTSPTGCACCPTTWPPRSGTTSWSPTPSTTRCAACGSPTATVTHARRAPAGSGAGRRHRRRAVEPVGRGLVAGPGLGRDGRRPPALDLRPAHRRRRGGGRHHQRGPARRAARRGVVRADLRARAPTGDRLWIADSETSSAALRRGRRGAHRRRHRAVRLRLPGRRRPARRCSSTRSG